MCNNFTFQLTTVRECFQINYCNSTINKMPLRLGDTVPNFKAPSTQGPLQFYDFQGDS